MMETFSVLVVVLVTIDCKKQTGYQACKDLNHKTMLARFPKE